MEAIVASAVIVPLELALTDTVAAAVPVVLPAAETAPLGPEVAPAAALALGVPEIVLALDAGGLGEWDADADADAATEAAGDAVRVGLALILPVRLPDVEVVCVALATLLPLAVAELLELATTVGESLLEAVALAGGVGSELLLAETVAVGESVDAATEVVVGVSAGD